MYLNLVKKSNKRRIEMKQINNIIVCVLLILLMVFIIWDSDSYYDNLHTACGRTWFVWGEEDSPAHMKFHDNNNGIWTYRIFVDNRWGGLILIGFEGFGGNSFSSNFGFSGNYTTETKKLGATFTLFHRYGDWGPMYICSPADE